MSLMRRGGNAFFQGPLQSFQDPKYDRDKIKISSILLVHVRIREETSFSILLDVYLTIVCRRVSDRRIYDQ
jgi:hypothetical protein